MTITTLIACIAAPTLGPALWRLIQWPGKKAAELVWKYMPYGRMRTLLLRESDPFAAVPPTRPRSPQAQLARRPRQSP